MRKLLILFFIIFLFLSCFLKGEFSIILNNLQQIKTEYMLIDKKGITINLPEGKVKIPLFLVRNIEGSNSKELNLFWYFKTGDVLFLSEYKKISNNDCQLEMVKLFPEGLKERCYNSFFSEEEKINIAEALFQRGLLNEALQLFSQVKNEGAPEKVFHLKGLIYFEKGEYQQAYDNWKEAYIMTSKNIYRLYARQALWFKNKKDNYKEVDLIKIRLLYPNDIGETNYRKIKSIIVDFQKELGDFFGFLPYNQILLIILPEENFIELTGAPKWAKGLTQEFIYLSQEGNLPYLIKHELTHAYINQLSFGKAPAWFQEGLAQYLSKKKHNYKDKINSFSSEKFENILEGMAADEGNPKWIFYKEALEKINSLMKVYDELAIRYYLSLLRKGVNEQEAFKKAFYSR